MAKKKKEVIPAYYWDASVFSAYVGKEEGRWEIVEGLLEDCDNGNICIWTSTLSIAEVSRGNIVPGKIVPMKVQNKIDAIWEPPSKIRLIEVSQLVVKEARNVIRALHGNKRTGIRSVDAVHLASAIQKEITKVHTYDSKLYGYANILDLKISEPNSNRFAFESTHQIKYNGKEKEQKQQ